MQAGRNLARPEEGRFHGFRPVEGRGRRGAAPPACTAGGLTAFIDQGSEFEGKLSFKDTVRIDGCFTGEIRSENTLIVGETGEIQASIHSKSVLISGTVVGDIVASQKVVAPQDGARAGQPRDAAASRSRTARSSTAR